MNPSVDTLAAACPASNRTARSRKSPCWSDIAQLLWEWNEKINLTRHTDYEKFVGRDLVDSLAFAEFLEQGEKVLDVGSGGGVPGVVLAIVRPDLKISLSDSVGKKAKVLERHRRAAGPENAGLPRPGQEALAKQKFRYAYRPGRRPSEKTSRMVQAALERFRSALGAQRAGLGRRTRRSPAFRIAEKSGPAEIEKLSPARHGIGKRSAFDLPTRSFAQMGARLAFVEAASCRRL